MTGVLNEVLAVLDGLARDGWHRARGRLAVALLEAYPLQPELHAHRALAALETDGVETARLLLRASTVQLKISSPALPEALLEAYRVVALVAVTREETEPTLMISGATPTARTLH